MRSQRLLSFLICVASLPFLERKVKLKAQYSQFRIGRSYPIDLKDRERILRLILDLFTRM